MGGGGGRVGLVCVGGVDPAASVIVNGMGFGSCEVEASGWCWCRRCRQCYCFRLSMSTMSVEAASVVAVAVAGSGLSADDCASVIKVLSVAELLVVLVCWWWLADKVKVCGCGGGSATLVLTSLRQRLHVNRGWKHTMRHDNVFITFLFTRFYFHWLKRRWCPRHR